ncbi:MAG: PaaI family thioesterase [Eubacteriales bacterium]
MTEKDLIIGPDGIREELMNKGSNGKEEQSGKGRMKKDALARHMGIELLEMKPGYARAVMKVTPELLNGEGLAHGGAIFCLADLAFAAAGNAHGPLALALNVNINFLSAALPGSTLTAVAREMNLTRKTGLYNLEVRDENNRLIAMAEGLAYRRSGEKKS